jgi:hypothetical protein
LIVPILYFVPKTIFGSSQIGAISEISFQVLGFFLIAATIVKMYLKIDDRIARHLQMIEKASSVHQEARRLFRNLSTVNPTIVEQFISQNYSIGAEEQILLDKVSTRVARSIYRKTLKEIDQTSARCSSCNILPEYYCNRLWSFTPFLPGGIRDDRIFRPFCPLCGTVIQASLTWEQNVLREKPELVMKTTTTFFPIN